MSTSPPKSRIGYPLAILVSVVILIFAVQLREAREVESPIEAGHPLSESTALPLVEKNAAPHDKPSKLGEAPGQVVSDSDTGAPYETQSEDTEVVDLGPRIRPEDPVTWSGDTSVVDLGERIRPEDKPIDSGYSTPIDLGPRLSADNRISYLPNDDEVIEIGEPMEVPSGTFIQATEGAPVELGPYIPIDPSPVNR